MQMSIAGLSLHSLQSSSHVSQAFASSSHVPAENFGLIGGFVAIIINTAFLVHKYNQSEKLTTIYHPLLCLTRLTAPHGDVFLPKCNLSSAQDNYTFWSVHVYFKPALRIPSDVLLLKAPFRHIRRHYHAAHHHSGVRFSEGRG